MESARTYRRFVIGAMILAMIIVSVTTVWLLSPLLREHSIREALLQEKEPSFWWPPSWRREHKLRWQLLQPVTMEFVETPLGDVVDFLRDFTNTNIVLDEVALKSEGITRDTPVSIHVQNARMGIALKLLLQEFNAVHVVKQDKLMITSQSQAKLQNAWAFEKTNADLAADQADEERIRQKLKHRVTLEFVETPLGDVIDFLRDFSQINFVLDREWLMKEGIDSDIPVTIHAQQVSLETALRELLEKMHGTFVIREGLIVFTSQSTTNERPR